MSLNLPADARRDAVADPRGASPATGTSLAVAAPAAAAPPLRRDRATTVTHRRARRARPTTWGVLGWVFLAILLLFTIVPMAWMVSTSLKTSFAAISQPPRWIPADPTLDNLSLIHI